MKKILVVLLFTGLAVVCLAQPRDVVRQVELRDPVSSSPDTRIYEVVQTFDDLGFPSGFHMKLLTDVCDDKLCKFLRVTLRWDALARYAKVDVPSNAPLTKLDHVEFSAEDYRKLDEILSDEYSILKQYSIADIGGDKDLDLDAVSGATPSAVQNNVIEGAAYTTWVLWRWVHGEITE